MKEINPANSARGRVEGISGQNFGEPNVIKRLRIKGVIGNDGRRLGGEVADRKRAVDP